MFGLRGTGPSEIHSLPIPRAAVVRAHRHAVQRKQASATLDVQQGLYSQLSLKRTPSGPKLLSALERVQVT